MLKGVLKGTGVSRPGTIKRIGEQSPPAVFAGRKLVADASSSADRGCLAPSSAAGGVLEGIQRRAERVAPSRAIAEEAWKREQVTTWSNAQDLVANAVALSHPKDGYEVLMFPNASLTTIGEVSCRRSHRLSLRRASRWKNEP